ncbi:MAG TPA: hypothetical protein PLW65_22035, partial [Pseudomonadota bacterium]|nr:hypothetical protein [Pseudomonadota bacterium]
MRVYFAAAVCTWGYLTCAAAPAHAAEITDLASSFEKGKPFGFKAGVSYKYTYKTASINREAVPLLQSAQTAKDINAHYQVPPGEQLSRTEIVPDLLFAQRRQSLSLDFAIGLFQDLQLGISIPLVLRDERQYDLHPSAGWNSCPAGAWDCVANSSSTFLDGIYPIQPSDQLSIESVLRWRRSVAMRILRTDTKARSSRSLGSGDPSLRRRAASISARALCSEWNSLAA